MLHVFVWVHILFPICFCGFRGADVPHAPQETWKLPGKQTENGRRGGKSLPAEVRLCLHHITKEHGSLGNKARTQWFSGENSSISRGICGIHAPKEARAGREGKEEPTPLTCSLVHGLSLRSCTFGFSSPKTSRDFGMYPARELGMTLTSSAG